MELVRRPATPPTRPKPRSMRSPPRGRIRWIVCCAALRRGRAELYRPAGAGRAQAAAAPRSMAGANTGYGDVTGLFPGRLRHRLPAVRLADRPDRARKSAMCSRWRCWTIGHFAQALVTSTHRLRDRAHPARRSARRGPFPSALAAASQWFPQQGACAGDRHLQRRRQRRRDRDAAASVPFDRRSLLDWRWAFIVTGAVQPRLAGGVVALLSHAARASAA